MHICGSPFIPFSSVFLLFSGALLFRMAGRLNFVRARSAEVFEEYQIRPYVINVDT